MSYRVQIELEESAPLRDKVLLHAKFLRHLQRRRLNADARGKTCWKMEFDSMRDRFEIIWTREPLAPITGNMRFKKERLLGWVLIKFSRQDIEIGGPLIVMGDWPAIEDHLLSQEKAA